MPDRNVIRFGAFEVAPESGELRKHGLRIKLQDQPFKLLVALLEKPGQVVSRDELRERIWGAGTFIDFDHGLSAAVNRLREALGDSAENPRYVETVARRGYRFIAPLENPVKPPAPAGDFRRKVAWAVLASLPAAGLGVGFLRARHRTASAPPRVLRLTALTGSESAPTFSPDGNQVAFYWDGERQDNFDIYVKMLGSTTALRLTTDPASDSFPAWSPDGRQIAFLSTRGRTGIYLVSPLGGPERKLIDMPGAGDRPSWSADSRFLVVAKSYSEPPAPGDGAVFLVPVEGGGEPRAILVPPAGTSYRHPAFSPDGRRLAVASCQGPVVCAQCQLQIVPLNRELFPQGAPRTVANQWSVLWGLAWMPDGASLVASGFQPPIFHLWRVPVAEPAEPERIEVAGEDALWPAISPKGDRLAFTRSIGESDIWRWQRCGKPSPFLTSTVRELSPQFSADGRHIAFESARSLEELAVWVANADGTGLLQVASVGSHSGTPRWSPDGQWIAFDAQPKGGRWDVWKVEASGAPRGR